MSRCVKLTDEEVDAKAGRKTRGIASTETVDSPLRRSSRVKTAGKHNESSPESPLSDNSNINNTQSLRNTERRISSVNNSTMTERSRTLRSKKNSGVSDTTETLDKHIAVSTPTKRSRNISNTDGFNKFDDQPSFSKRLTRAGSESKSPLTITRPTRRTRASSMGPDTVIENVLEINTPVNTRKRRSMVPIEKTVIEDKGEKMVPFVTLDRVLPNLKEMNETCSENSITEESNKSISSPKETLNLNSENTCNEEIEARVDVKKEHTPLAKNSPVQSLQENETDMPINKNTSLDISETGRTDSTDSITQMKTSVLDIPKTQSTEVTPKKLRLKDESSTNNVIKEEDENLSNKENRASNIIEDSQTKDATVSNILPHSSQPLFVSDVSTEKSVKLNEEDADSSDNMQNLIVTDTDSSSGTPHNDSKGWSILCIQVCEDSSSDGNIQISKCPENVNTANALTPLNVNEDQSALSEEIQDNSNENENLQIQKSEESANDTHTNEFLGFDNNQKEQIHHVTSEDETITTDENVEIRVTLEAEKTVNLNKEKAKEIGLTQIETANDKFEMNTETGESCMSKNLNDRGDTEYSKLSNMSIDKTSTSALISMDETTSNDLQDTQMNTKVPSHEIITKESFGVLRPSNNFELVNESENNITDVIEDIHTSNVIQSSPKPIDKTLEEVDVTQNTSEVDTCLTSEEKSMVATTSQNDIEENEISETVQKQKEKMQVNGNNSQANINIDLFQDIPADEWKEKNSDKNSVHSMSTERMENECDDFVLGDTVSLIVGNVSTEKEKDAIDYDSDDTVLLKLQKDGLKEKTVEQMDTSESQCKMNENTPAKIKNIQKSIQQEEIDEAENIINDAEVKLENEKGRVENQKEEIQNTENVSTRTPITNKVSKQSPLASDIVIEKLVDKNITNEINQNLNVLSTESSLNNRESKSNERKSIRKSVEKSDDEVEEPKEVNIAEKEDSLNKSPASSPSNVSDLSKTDESIDSDIEREYNLHGGEVSKFSDDDVPGDECRASETELSDPDDNGSDLADFVVSDDDEIIEEDIDSNESSEESYNGQSDRHRESDNDTINKQCRKIQIQQKSDEKTVKEGKQKRMDTSTFKKEKNKFKKSVKLDLNKIIEGDKNIIKPDTRIINKKRKRIRIDDSDDDISGGNVEGSENEKKLDNRKIVGKQKIGKDEGDKQYRKVQIHKEIVKKVTKKAQKKKSAEENVRGTQNKCTDIARKEKSQLGKSTKLDLVEKLESVKNVKRKSKNETSNKIKKRKLEDNDNKMLKRNAVLIHENRPAECSKTEASRKRVKRLSVEVIENLTDLPKNISRKRKLLTPERRNLPSRLIPHSLLEKRKVCVKQDYISLSSYGSTTNFFVENLQKMKKAKKNSQVQSFRQRMLNRNPRQPVSYYTMYLEKQAATNRR